MLSVLNEHYRDGFKAYVKEDNKAFTKEAIEENDVCPVNDFTDHCD